MPEFAKLCEAVDAYCDKYCITPRFKISDVFDIKNKEHWAQDWPFAERAGCYVVYSASGDLLYIGEARRIATRLELLDRP